jgi:hypothetical protein
MNKRTKVRTITAARMHGYCMRYVSMMKTRGVIEDPGWGYVYLEDVAEYRAKHPIIPPYGRLRPTHKQDELEEAA